MLKFHLHVKTIANLPIIGLPQRNGRPTEFGLVGSFYSIRCLSLQELGIETNDELRVFFC